jgi:hypothetical protein
MLNRPDHTIKPDRTEINRVIHGNGPVFYIRILWKSFIREIKFSIFPGKWSDKTYFLKILNEKFNLKYCCDSYDNLRVLFKGYHYNITGDRK